MSYSYRELTAQSDDQLITEHDELAARTSVGVDFYLAELRRREQAKSNVIMVRLTVMSTALAVVAVIIAVVSLLVR